MDSSISDKVRIALGEERVRLSDLTLEEMVCIFQKTITSVKPNLKYLPGFSPIGEMLNCEIEGLSFRRTALSTTKFSDGISVRTKVTNVDTLLKKIDGQVAANVQLLLTDEGKLVMWMADYKLLEREVCGNPPAIDWEATSSSFETMSPDRVEDQFGQEDLWKNLLYAAILKLCRLSSSGLIEREGRIRGIRDTVERTSQVLQNIVIE